MKNRLYRLTSLLMTVLCITIAGCEDSGSGKNCFTPPNDFNFKIADETTGEDLFTNGTFKSNEIVITDTNTQKKIPFTFIAGNENNLIIINTIGWKTEKVNYSIVIKNKPIFELFVDASRLSNDGCSYTEYNEILIKNATYGVDKEKGTYIINFQ